MTTRLGPLPPDFGSAAPEAWWRGAIVYQIYPRSFKDSNGDGLGDLEGVITELDHVASLGVEAIWLSPFFPSPMRDFGYDVADYCDVDPRFGTLTQFDRLVAEAHNRGIKVLIDLVLSHSSDSHPWFEESRASRDNPKADWYVWAEPQDDGTPPNNWLAQFSGQAWSWEPRRRQYYLHNFLPSQPDLNFYEPAVQDALLDVARFWLERGVDGFRLDVVNLYAHDRSLADNPRSDWTDTPPKPVFMQWPVHNSNQPLTLKFVERLRGVLDAYGATTSIGEMISPYARGRFTAEYTAPGRLHMAYNFALLTAACTPAAVAAAVSEIAEASADAWPNWAVSNHDTPRVASRWGDWRDRRAPPLYSALAACLRGSACLYQGEELGLPEADLPLECLQDPEGLAFWPAHKGRDGCRTPMPWLPTPDVGFSTGAPWLPIAETHRPLAVSLQADDAASPLERLRRFYAWRRHRTSLRRGDHVPVAAPTPLLGFVRRTETERLLCLFNLGAEPSAIAVPDGLELMEVGGFEGMATLSGNDLVLQPWGLAIAAY